MFGGIAVARNLLCIAHAEARGKVLLVDLDERRLVSCWDYGPDDGYADAGGVAMADDFSIFVADTRNDVVRRFSPFGKELARFGHRPPRQPGSVSRDRNGVLDRPRAVAVAGDVLYVACGERELARGVQRLSLDGAVLQPLRSGGEADARFGAPRGVWADAVGVLVADTLHGAVQRFSADGRFLGQVDTAQAPGESSRPVAAARLADGSVLVAEHGDRPGLKRFEVDGPALPVPPATAAHGCLDGPVGLAVDERGRVYVLDRDGERVQRLHPDLGFDTLVVDLAEVLYGG
jgi:sugar lactone lactonase YvrE